MNALRNLIIDNVRNFFEQREKTEIDTTPNFSQLMKVGSEILVQSKFPLKE